MPFDVSTQPLLQCSHLIFLKKFIFGVMPPPDPNVKNGFILDNLVASIPNDEDLRVAYTNEANALQVRGKYKSLLVSNEILFE